MKFTLQVAGEQTLVAPELLGKRKPAKIQGEKVVFDVPLAVKSGEAVLKLSLSYGYCRGGTGGLCKIATNVWKIPVEISTDAKAESLTLSAAPKQ